MYKGKKVIVVMPAYNASKTLRKTHKEVTPEEIVDLVIVVDDGSHDETVSIAKSLPDTLVYRNRKLRFAHGSKKYPNNTDLTNRIGSKVASIL